MVRTVGVEPTSPSGATVLKTAVFAVPPRPHEAGSIPKCSPLLFVVELVDLGFSLQ